MLPKLPSLKTLAARARGEPPQVLSVDPAEEKAALERKVRRSAEAGIFLEGYITGHNGDMRAKRELDVLRYEIVEYHRFLAGDILQ